MLTANSDITKKNAVLRCTFSVEHLFLSNKDVEFYDGIKFYKDPRDGVGVVHATLVVEGESRDDADNRAKDRLNRTLDKLAYSSGKPYQEGWHFRLGTLFMTEEVDERAFSKHEKESSKATKPPIDISQINNVKDEKKCKSLLKALGHFRRAIDTDNIFDAFLSFWRCIEVIIGEEIGKKEVTSKDRINFLKDFRTQGEVERLYRSRCAIAHGGIDMSSYKKEEDIEIELYEVYKLATEVVSKYLKKYSPLSVM